MVYFIACLITQFRSEDFVKISRKDVGIHIWEFLATTKVSTTTISFDRDYIYFAYYIFFAATFV